MSERPDTFLHQGTPAVQPPSTVSAVPVTNELASEARNTAGPTISSGLPARPSAWSATVACHHAASPAICWTSGVSMELATWLHLISPRHGRTLYAAGLTCRERDLGDMQASLA